MIITIICEQCGDKVKIEKKRGRIQKKCTACANGRRKTDRKRGGKYERNYN
jgi:hypothetical protein